MAGVSTATVSRVINQTAWVEPVTRERVEKAMRDLNYRRNAAAIALAKRSGDMLGLLTGNLADPFFARLARGVEDVSRKQQYRLMVCSGGHDEEMEKAGLDFLVNQGCEAIVVHASRLPDKELLRYAAHFPALVVVNRYIAGMANRCIWLENRSAAREATRYLLALAYRRCEFLIFSFPILRFASDSCLVWTLMGWTSLTPSPFRRRLPHGMKADSGWIRYWITWRKTAAGLLNRRQSTFPGQELSRRREPIYYGWIVKNWDWMTNS